MSKLFVDEIVHQSSQGSGTITIGASGEKVDLGTGVSGGTLTNTPAFRVYKNANQSIANNTFTKVTFQVEDYDTDNAFASDKFTVPSGKAGKYAFQYGGWFGGVVDNKVIAFRLYKNGSFLNLTYTQSTISANHVPVVNGVSSLDLAVGDYVELYIVQDTGSSQDLNAAYTRFEGYRLIG